MTFFHQFTTAFLFYLNEIWGPIVFGFLLSGILYEFVPTSIVEKYLGQKGMRPIMISSFVGTLLPICCFGTLPIAIALRQKGARLGPVLAFLVTTPATSVSALFVCWRLLGPTFTIYIFFAVILMGVVIGMLANNMPIPLKKTDETKACCCAEGEGHQGSHAPHRNPIKNVLTYAFVTLPKEIGFELLLGIIVASFVMVFQPAHVFIKEYLQGIFGYAFSLMIGLATYVCSTASVPMADAFIKNGMPYGPAMVYLLVGPITSYGMIFALKKEFGWNVLGLYLAVICFLSVFFGIVFNFLIAGTAF